MIVETLLYQRRWLLLGALLGVGIGLYITGEEAASGTRAPVAHAAQVATRPSRSSTIAVSEDAALVAIVNSQAGSLSVYRTADAGRVSAIETGGEPSSVVIAPDSKTAYVANRADGTVVRISGLDGAHPEITARVAVGTDPVGLALAPSGRQLFVAEVANDRVSVIATATMTIEAAIAVARPRSLLISNNGDHRDDDEVLLVSQGADAFAAGGDAGRVVRLRLADLRRAPT